MLEKRKHQRIEIGIRISSKDGRIRVFTRNLSIGGCFIERSEDFYLLPIGSTIPFFLEIPGGHAYIEIDGVVKHYGKEGDGMGICFGKTKYGIPLLIKKFLQKYSYV